MAYVSSRPTMRVRRDVAGGIINLLASGCWLFACYAATVTHHPHGLLVALLCVALHAGIGVYWLRVE